LLAGFQENFIGSLRSSSDDAACTEPSSATTHMTAAHNFAQPPSASDLLPNNWIPSLPLTWHRIGT
jgi:hypothetical protein